MCIFLKSDVSASHGDLQAERAVQKQFSIEQSLAIEHLRDLLQQLPCLDEIVYVRCAQLPDGEPYHARNMDRLDLHLPSSRQGMSSRSVTQTCHDDLANTNEILEEILINFRRIDGTHDRELDNIQPLALLLSALDYPGSSGLQQL